jgi:hypothetical protein
MHPRLLELSRYLDSCRASLLSAAEAVPPAHRHESPRPDSWSVAQILEHLGIVESRIARLLVRQTAEAMDDNVHSEAGEHCGEPIDLDSIAGGAKKVVASEASHPTQKLSWSAALTALQNSRERLLTAISEVDGRPLERVVAAHPSVGELNMYDWIAFVGAHELRHANQVREVADQLAANHRGDDRPDASTPAP